MASSSSTSPCAACKFLRRKCQPDCMFAPYFPPDQPLKFSNVHKVFGASNVTKLLSDLHPHQRQDAANSLAYEADMRIRDPVYGCVGIISLLQHQLRQLQTDLGRATSELSKHNNVGIAGLGLIGPSNGHMGFGFARDQQLMVRNFDTEMARLGADGYYDENFLAMNGEENVAPLDQLPRRRGGSDGRRIIGPS